MIFRYGFTALSVALTSSLAFSSAPAAADAAPCDAVEVEYALDAHIAITDTPLGAGNGSYDIGPGALVLRFPKSTGDSGSRVELVRYETAEQFTVVTKALGRKTQVHVDTTTHVTPDACGVAARGSVVDGELRWDTPWRGVRTDGTVTCEGSFCGKFGAPQAGTSAFHVAPHEADIQPLVLAADEASFTMAPSVISRLDSPRQTTSVSLEGRESGRRCVALPPSCL